LYQYLRNIAHLKNGKSLIHVPNILEWNVLLFLLVILSWEFSAFLFLFTFIFVQTKLKNHLPEDLIQISAIIQLRELCYFTKNNTQSIPTIFSSLLFRIEHPVTLKPNNVYDE
jgi:hypothetical protein